MSDKAFLDTNILVYAYDQNEPRKQSIAQNLITDGIEKENLLVSVQVLGEFFNVVSRHIPQPMTSDQAQEIISIISYLPVQEIDLAMVNRAIDIHKRYQISYCDALIVSAAERAGCTLILSEDLNGGQAYHDIVVRNPFTNTHTL